MLVVVDGHERDEVIAKIFLFVGVFTQSMTINTVHHTVLQGAL